MVGGGRKNANKCYPEKDSSVFDDTQPVDTQISPDTLPGKFFFFFFLKEFHYDVNLLGKREV